MAQPKEMKELPKVLWEDEKVEKIVQGFHENGSGILAATNKRLIFVDKRRLGGLRVKDFPYDKVTSIKYNTGLLMGGITIYSSGHKSEITNIQKAIVGPFAEYVRARITSTSQPAIAPVTPSPSAPVTPSPSAPVTPPTQQEDVISKLERLGALKDKGIITDQEFEEQKAKLLGTETANQSQKRVDPQTGRPL
jgi:hypothetical protein